AVHHLPEEIGMKPTRITILTPADAPQLEGRQGGSTGSRPFHRRRQHSGPKSIRGHWLSANRIVSHRTAGASDRRGTEVNERGRERNANGCFRQGGPSVQLPSHVPVG